MQLIRTWRKKYEYKSADTKQELDKYSKLRKNLEKNGLEKKDNLSMELSSCLWQKKKKKNSIKTCIQQKRIGKLSIFIEMNGTTDYIEVYARGIFSSGTYQIADDNNSGFNNGNTFIGFRLG